MVLAIVFWFARRHAAAPKAAKAAGLVETLALLRRPKIALGTLCIFIYVGAEVAIGSLMTNYLLSLHLTASQLSGVAEAADRPARFRRRRGPDARGRRQDRGLLVQPWSGGSSAPAC